ncbi:peptide chain release factor N(5)-glutamine methyltransferase [Sporosarcina sp. 179-K 3D1 HS]|uniref:peptide chain release factor N(5)-glutamine methyltransferase n=1 Tax=Sporosarcina sp. 179-K 3D1 HS TaxID=3232169 RepID=UPI0039A2BB1D
MRSSWKSRRTGWKAWIAMTEKIHEALHRASSLLKERGLETHAAHLLMESVTGKPGAALLADLREPLTPEQSELFWNQTEELLTGKPVQYIIGTEDFYGRSFLVNEHVLIPRPETEELVLGAINRGNSLFRDKTIQMADIGTGSGAIAITLKKEWPEAKVTATDISEEALAVARKNAARHQADVTFLRGDMAAPIINRTWDIILSNPPYIAHEEAREMSDTVLGYEPHGALFADEDGLFFYRKLAESLPPLMNKPALIGLEIGHLQGPAVCALFEKAFPAAMIELIKDINGKDRMIFCKIGE